MHPGRAADGLQQPAALLQGAANDERVVVQYAQNFSFLIFRPERAPDILTSKNKERSSKAISCVNVEGDEAAFGSRADKMVVCKLHRDAWRDNLDYVKPLCLRVCPPRSDHEPRAATARPSTFARSARSPTRRGCSRASRSRPTRRSPRPCSGRRRENCTRRE